MPSKRKLARKGPSSTSLPELPSGGLVAARRLREFVVITPPSVDMEEPFVWDCNSLNEADETLDSDLSISSMADDESVGCISLDCSENESGSNAERVEQNSTEDALLTAKKTLSTSRSCGSISTQYPMTYKDVTDSKSLQIPKRHKTLRSQSAEYCKSHLPKFIFSNQAAVSVDTPHANDVGKKRSRTPLHKQISRSRSASPVPSAFTRSQQSTKSNTGDTLEGTKAGWSRTLRFLSRRQPSASFTASSTNASKEFLWQDVSIKSFLNIETGE